MIKAFPDILYLHSFCLDVSLRRQKQVFFCVFADAVWLTSPPVSGNSKYPAGSSSSYS